MTGLKRLGMVSPMVLLKGYYYLAYSRTSTLAN